MNGIDTRWSDAPRRRGSRSAALAGRPDRQRLGRRLLGRLRRRRSSGAGVRRHSAARPQRPSRRGMFLLVFLPVLVVARLGAARDAAGRQLVPEPRARRGRATSGIRDVVRDVGTWIGVLAFGIGYALGAALEPMPRRTRSRRAGRRSTATAADEPLTRGAPRDGVEPVEPVDRASRRLCRSSGADETGRSLELASGR